METVSVVTEVLVNIVLGGFSLAMIVWVLLGIQMIVNERRQEKRDQESAARDSEYHLARMHQLKQ